MKRGAGNVAVTGGMNTARSLLAIGAALLVLFSAGCAAENTQAPVGSTQVTDSATKPGVQEPVGKTPQGGGGGPMVDPNPPGQTGTPDR